MKIGVIGAGPTGFGAAFHLAKRGHEVVLVESEKEIGGLARAFRFDDNWVELFYHFITTADTDLLDMVRELGIEDRLNWVETETSFFANGRLYPFTSPVDLLGFSAIGLTDRFRFIATMLYLTKLAGWRRMEDLKACEFLPRWAGRRTWDVVFEPMFKMKFGDLTPQMSMAWMWARSRMIKQYREKGVARERRAWIKGSYKTFLDALARWFAEHGVETLTGATTERLLVEGGVCRGLRVDGRDIECDRVVFTAPSFALAPLLSDGADPYFDLIREQRYFGAICVVMSLDEPLSDQFWTYVSDPRVPFVGVIDYSTFTRFDGAEGQNVIYIPYYSLPSEPPFTMPDEELIRTYTEGLKIAFPGFDERRIRAAVVNRSPTAAIVCAGRYSERIPPIKTPIENFFFANMSQVYPQDRGVSVGVKLGVYAAEAAERNEDVRMDFVPY